MKTNKENIIENKSFKFALISINLFKYLTEHKREYVISKQFLRCGTSIGALVREAGQAESKADFIHKMSIALKEAKESEYWVDLLNQSSYLGRAEYDLIVTPLYEIIKLLVSIIKSAKNN